jgi:hypothetical protein
MRNEYNINYKDWLKVAKDGTFYIAKACGDYGYGKGVIIHFINKNEINILDKYSGRFYRGIDHLGTLHTYGLDIKSPTESETQWLQAAESSAVHGEIFRKKYSKIGKKTNNYSII